LAFIGDSGGPLTVDHLRSETLEVEYVWLPGSCKLPHDIGCVGGLFGIAVRERRDSNANGAPIMTTSNPRIMCLNCWVVAVSSRYLQS
jgi:hypothetical protein